MRFLQFLLVTAVASASSVTDVRQALARGDFRGAEQALAAYRKQNGTTPEAILALTWLGRGALGEKRLDQAIGYAGEAHRLVLEQLKTRPLDAGRDLPLALGAAIELRAQALTAGGQRSEAVSYLTRELKTYRETSIRARLQKNLNLLTLEGKPAPPLEVGRWLGPKPQPLASLRGRPVLLFFWAHWCGDCRSEIPVLARIRQQFGPRGLVLIGPTQHYGYVAGGEEAPPDRELAYIEQVRRSAYAPLTGVPVPVSEENFKVYGASTTPTLVLVDRDGIVRMYHPDVIAYEELAARIEKVLAAPAARARSGS